MSETIIKEVDNHIMRLVINRPHKRNALTEQMYAALADGLAEAAVDEAVRVVFITGTERSFTSGNDLGDFLQNPPVDQDSPVSRFLYQISHAEKPLVAAVNGVAVGVGTTMLLHCDLVYAAETAVFSLPFVDLALVPEASSSYLMPRMMGHQKAAALLMLCEKIDAREAEAVGFVNRVVPDDQLEAFAWQKAVALAQKAPEAVQLTKMLLKEGQMDAIEQRMRTESKLFRERLASAEAREVMMAFMEKRQPDFF